MKQPRTRPTPPIINFGKLRIDYPSRERPLKENLKFVAFVAVLLVVFILLYQVQAHFLMQRNVRETAPDLRTLNTTP